MTRWPILLFTALVALGQTPAIPKFEQFPATQKFAGKPAAPIFTTSADRAFRTSIREGAGRGPNFAGHLTVVTWGCGSSCLGVRIVDARTGQINHDLPEFFSFGPQQFPDGTSLSSPNFEPLSYELDSRLLILRGCPAEDHCALYCYGWTGKGLRLLSRSNSTRDR